jgi:hypothetical protein
MSLKHEKFGMYDSRRVQMARDGFEVCQVHIDPTTREVISVWYRYDGEVTEDHDPETPRRDPTPKQPEAL